MSTDSYVSIFAEVLSEAYKKTAFDPRFQIWTIIVFPFLFSFRLIQAYRYHLFFLVSSHLCTAMGSLQRRHTFFIAGKTSRRYQA